jgi:hypothetical protein
MSSHVQHPSFLLTLSLLPLSDVSFAFSPWQENDSGGRALSSCQRTSLLQLTSAIFRFLMSCHPTSIISSFPFPFTIEWRVFYFKLSSHHHSMSCHVIPYHLSYCVYLNHLHRVFFAAPHRHLASWAVCLKLSGFRKAL